MPPSPPVVSIVGKSDSGKTTLIVRLIPLLRARGYRIGTIKHSSHDFDVDRPGKDSHRHKTAGADAVMVAGPERIAMVKDVVDPELDDLIAYFNDMDLVLVEGYKRAGNPKIEICRAERSTAPLCLDDPNLVAMVTDLAIDRPDLLVFAPDDVHGLADFIETRFMQKPVAVAGAGKQP